MSRMNDEDIASLIREASRDESRSGTSSDFTLRVLGKLEESESRSRAQRRSLVWATAGVVLLVGLVSQGYLRSRLEQWRAAERVQALRDEYRELQTELEKLRVLAREVEPILELGGTEQVDFVFDLRELAEKPPDGPATEPVSHSPR